MTLLLQRVAALFSLAVSVNAAQAAPVETVLASFYTNSKQGVYPLGGVIQDKGGNLYGTTGRGGHANAGTVFELSPPAQGKAPWTLRTLFEFNGRDGQAPRGNLIFDEAGNLYGTTAIGGANNDGTVYKLSPPANGATRWHHTVLTSFPANAPAYPYAGVVFDSAGNLYGTLVGTTNNKGKLIDSGVFELSPPSQGHTGWTETVIASRNGAKGTVSTGALLFDSAGNLYGTGSNDVFELSPPAQGQTKWTETILTTFKGLGISSPLCTLVADAAGNLYGTANNGDFDHQDGAVFELSPPKSGKTHWTTQVIFVFDGPDGGTPTEGNLLITSAGQLIGTTAYGGKNDTGVMFELAPPAQKGGAWTGSLLNMFNGGANGVVPIGDLIMDSAGFIYGTTAAGGKGSAGVVYRLKP
jgi:uncharacterized repeat protein (TIGR03803 family)